MNAKPTDDIIFATYEQADIEHMKQILKEKEKEREVLARHDKKLTHSTDDYWSTYIKGDNGKRKQVRRKERTHLINFLYDYYREVDAEVEPCFNDLYSKWIQEKLDIGDITDSTYSRYNNDFRRFFTEDEPFTQIKLKDVTEHDLELFIKRQITKHQLTRKTYSGLRILLIGVFKYAKSQHFTSLSISIFFDDLYLPKKIFKHKPRTKASEEVFTNEEVKKLFDYLNSEKSSVALGVKLNFFVGMRVGELSALKPEDVDIKKGVIHVHRTEQNYKNVEGKRITEVVDSTKTDNGDRYITIPDSALNILRQLMLLNGGKEYLFYNQHGNRATTKCFQKMLSKACDKVNIPHRPMHKIRKTYASKLLRNSLDKALITEQMGHSEIATTEKYYHFDSFDDNEKRTAINNAVSY